MWKELNVTGEELWRVFTSTFRPTFLMHLSGPQQLSWIIFLGKNSLHVEQKKCLPQQKGLTYCIEASGSPRLNIVSPSRGASPFSYTNTNPSPTPKVGNTNQNFNSNERSTQPPHHRRHKYTYLQIVQPLQSQYESYNPLNADRN